MTSFPPPPLVIIPARWGSKGVPFKNWRPLAGQRPVHRAIYAAQDAGLSNVVVSTDSPVIAAGCLAAYVHFRPEMGDENPMLEVVQRVLAEVEHAANADTIVILQPSSPLRTASHIRAALEEFRCHEFDSVFSVVEVPAAFAPERVLRPQHPMLPGPSIAPVIPPSDFVRMEGSAVYSKPDPLGAARRRQDCAPSYVRDGTVYVVRRSVVEAGSLYGDRPSFIVIPPFESCSIDTWDDWQRAETILKARLGQ